MTTPEPATVTADTTADTSADASADTTAGQPVDWTVGALPAGVPAFDPTTPPAPASTTPSTPVPTGPQTITLGVWQGTEHTATLRDPDDITNGQRNRLLEQMDAAAGSDSRRGVWMMGELAKMLVQSWTLPLPVPSEPGGDQAWQDVPARLVNPIMLAGQGAQRVLFPSFDVSPEPTSPTPASNG